MNRKGCNRRTVQGKQENMTEAECEQLNDSIAELGKALNTFQIAIGDRLARVETKIDNERALCPFREEIARASNNGSRLAQVETQMDALKSSLHAMEVTLAKSSLGAGAAGGGIFGVVGVVAFVIGKGAGWW
jgi:hypothetical protein